MSKKTYILDTNILMQAPNSIYGFEDNDIVITPTTLEELDHHKNDYGEAGYNARSAIRIIGSLREKGNFIEGIKLNNEGGIIRVEFNHINEELPDGWTTDNPDNRIIQCAKALTKQDEHTILVSNDVNMQVKASCVGVKVQSYLNTRASDESIKYTGRKEVYLMPDVIEELKKNKKILPEKLYDFGDKNDLQNNDFLIIHNAVDTNSTLLGLYRKGFVQTLRYVDSNPSDISPRNIGQQFAQEALMMPADEVPLVILKGPAGTAKTFYSLAVGLEMVTNQNTYRSMLITRPNIKFDDDIGFLKGDEMDKIMPLIRPCYDNLEQLLSYDLKSEDRDAIQSKIEYLFHKGYIKAEAMAYMRGRSLSNTYMVIDECQNSTPNQMLGLITRAGVGTKIVITGDIKQIDNPKLDKKNNGLSFASERMRGNDLCMQVLFDETECERSALSKIAADKLSIDKLK